MGEPGIHNPVAPDYPASVEEVLRRIYDKNHDAIRVIQVGGSGGITTTSTSTTTTTSTSTTTTA